MPNALDVIVTSVSTISMVVGEPVPTRTDVKKQSHAFSQVDLSTMIQSIAKIDFAKPGRETLNSTGAAPAG